MHMKLRYAFLILFVFLISQLNAQSIVQQVTGVVTDLAQDAPIEGVKVTVEGENELSALTDAKGRFQIDNVPVGRRRIRFEKADFATYLIPDQVVDAGKVLSLEIKLSETQYTTGPVVITAKTTSRDLQSVSTRTFTVEESRRFAAAYFDPARLVTSYPGVMQTNDQANHLVVRGNSPNGIVWRLEGVDILSPNHHSNAGTFTDRPAASGGGTIILSAQMLANSQFHAGAFDARFGNATAGVFDIHLRKGNTDKPHFTAQAGVIGVDLSAEGPIGKNGASFLANYRYSFTGLLAVMGITFGGEDIRFQDFSFNLHLPTKKAGVFTLFGIGGLSSNEFEGPRADSLREEGKDRFDIRFYSDMGAAGATHKLLLSPRTLWRSTVAISALNARRFGDLILTDTAVFPTENDRLRQSRLSFASHIDHKIGRRAAIPGGLDAYRYGFDLRSTFTPFVVPTTERVIASGAGDTWLLQPYVQGQFALRPGLDLRAGIHGMYLTLNGSAVAEPRASLSWTPAPAHNLRFAYGLHSQMQQPGLYFSTPNELRPEDNPNRELGFTRAHHLVLSYGWNIRPGLELRVEPYFQRYFGVPVSVNPQSLYSGLNQFEGYVVDSLVNEGTGRNYGIETSLERVFNKNYYFLVSGSLFRALNTAADGVERSGRFDGRYQFSATGGYEKAFGKKSKILSVNLRAVYRGGFLAQPIDAVASAAEGRTVFVANEGFTDQLGDFFRTDLRVAFKRNRAKLTRTFAIDIQNVTNRQNEAFRVYDPVLGRIDTRYQLGMIPLLSYLVEF